MSDRSQAAKRPAVAIGPALELGDGVPCSLVDVFRRATANSPEKGITFVDEAGRSSRLTYAELGHLASRYLSGLRNQRFHTGRELIVLPQSTSEFVGLFWGAVLAGMIPVPLPGGQIASTTQTGSTEVPVEVERLASVWRQLDRPTVVIPRESELLRSSIERAAPDLSECLHTPDALLANEASNDWSEPQRGDVALLLYSSGSTSDPKGVSLSHQNLLADAESTRAANRFGSSDTTLCWAPLYHVIGLTCFHLLPVYTQADQVIMQPAALIKKPELWFEFIHQHRVAFTGGPNFAFSLATSRITQEQLGCWDLSCLKVLLNGGEVVSVSTLRKFLAHFAPAGLCSNAIAPAYGMSEAAGGIAYPDPAEPFREFRLKRELFAEHGEVRIVGPSEADAIEIANLGRPLPGMSLRIVDDQDHVRPELEVGHIQIRGDAVTEHGYKGDEGAATTRVDGWLRTGDLGFLCEGQLGIVGRSKEIIIVNGRNYAGHDLEQAAQSVTGVQPGRVVATSVYDDALNREKVLVFAAALNDDPELPKLIAHAVRRATGLEVDEVHLLAEAQFPRSAAGKLQRQKVRDLYLAGSFGSGASTRRTPQEIGPEPQTADAQASLSRETIENHLAAKLAGHLGVEASQIDVDALLADLGVSSVIALTFAADLEKQLDVAFPVTLLFDYASVSELTTYLLENVDQDRLMGLANQSVDRA